MNIWELIFSILVLGVIIKFRNEIWRSFKGAMTIPTEVKERRHELEKLRIEKGISFDRNQFTRHVLSFIVAIVGLTAVIVICISTLLSSFSTSILDNNDVSSSLDFNGNMDMQFDGYFTKEITKKSVKVNPDCRDTFEYMEYSYIEDEPSLFDGKMFEKLEDTGFIEYSGTRPCDPLYITKLKCNEDNSTTLLYKKNLKDCEREITEVESAGEFIPTNLTVNGFTINGSGSGASGNIIGFGVSSAIISELQSELSDLNDYRWEHGYK